MTASHGQRFRRRAVRRGYKVDEVDSFLDRVEDTLNGHPIGAPIAPQEVHDVVFRVRFGGYDEWQVDLHLDRVERQLAELAERAAAGPAGRTDPRMAPERPGPPPLPTRTPTAHGPTSTLPRYDQAYADAPTFAGQPPAAAGAVRFDGFEAPRARNDMTGELRPAGMQAPMSPAVPFGGGVPQGMPQSPMQGMPPGPPSGAPADGPGFGAPQAHRVDQLRRTFQLRRFGSGYDPAQVDQLFDGVMATLAGRGGVNSAELDPARLALVPGGYYEAEVEQAIREVRDILSSRR